MVALVISRVSSGASEHCTVTVNSKPVNRLKTHLDVGKDFRK